MAGGVIVTLQGPGVISRRVVMERFTIRGQHNLAVAIVRVLNLRKHDVIADRVGIRPRAPNDAAIANGTAAGV